MTTLADMAEQYADSVQAQALNIENQLLDLEAEQAKLDERKAKLLAAREAARSAHQRLANYDGSGCFYCWIGDGVAAALRPIGGGNTTTDMMRCTRCDHVIGVDF